MPSPNFLVYVFYLLDDCVRLFGLGGCIDPTFVEYNPYALIDDSSCITPIVYGCTDSTAYTYNSNSNTDDGSCCHTSFGSLQRGQTFYDSQIGQHTGNHENKRASISYDGNRIAIGIPDSSFVLFIVTQRNWKGLVQGFRWWDLNQKDF